jgi:hypothetical protein
MCLLQNLQMELLCLTLLAEVSAHLAIACKLQPYTAAGPAPKAGRPQDGWRLTGKVIHPY